MISVVAALAELALGLAIGKSGTLVTVADLRQDERIAWIPWFSSWLWLFLFLMD